MKAKIKQNLFKFNTFRRVVQFLSFLFFSAMVFNMVPQPLLLPEPLLLPVLWTWGFQSNIVGDAFTAIQLMFYETVFPWLAFASFLITGILIGKSLCGWVCPFGFIQDLIDFAKRKKTEISPRTHENMLYVKYAILGISLFISVTFSAAKVFRVHSSYESAFGIFVKMPFTTLSPAETLLSTLPNGILNFKNVLLEKPLLDVLSGVAGFSPLLWVQLFILGGFLVFAAYVPRSWCKYFCPHGAIMAILNRFSFLGLKRDLTKCAKAECRQCVEVCPMRVRILDLPWEKFSDPECIYCLKCVDSCPNKAIKLKYP